MTARDAISPINRAGRDSAAESVSGDMHLLEVLPRLLDSPRRELEVTDPDGLQREGLIDQTSLLEAIGRLIATRGDCSVIELTCTPTDYSASLIGRAVEDADMHLVDLLSTPGADGRLHITLRVRCEDPSPAVHSLERYGYEITGVFGHKNVDRTAAIERLLELQAIINV